MKRRGWLLLIGALGASSIALAAPTQLDDLVAKNIQARGGI